MSLSASMSMFEHIFYSIIAAIYKLSAILIVFGMKCDSMEYTISVHFNALSFDI